MSEARVPIHVRRRVAERAAYLCEYCRYPEDHSPHAFCIDHLRPRSRRGTNALANLGYACTGCNSHKSDRTKALDPDTRLQVSLFHPRRQRWHDHFAWSPDRTLVLGLTATGRATVVALHLNRQGVVNLRRVLVGLGKHPPVDPEGDED